MAIPSGGARIVVTYGFDTGRLGTVADLDADAGWVPVQLDCAPHAGCVAARGDELGTPLDPDHVRPATGRDERHAADRRRHVLERIRSVMKSRQPVTVMTLREEYQADVYVAAIIDDDTIALAASPDGALIATVRTAHLAAVIPEL